MGGCGSHSRVKSALFKHPMVEYRATLESSPKGMGSLPIRFTYIRGTDEYPNTSPELTSVNKSTDLQFVPTTDEKHLSISKLCLSLSPSDDQIRECSIEFVAENFPINGKREGSVTITLDGNSTSFDDSANECSSVGDVETDLYPANKRSQVLIFDVARLPLEIGEQLKKFLSTDNPEVKAAAAKLRELVTKLPTLDNSQRQQLTHMLRRSLDQNICVNENCVEITGESDNDPNFYGSSSSSNASVESEQIISYCDFKLSRSKTVGSKTSFCISDDISDSGYNTASLEHGEKIENIQSSDVGLVEFSKRQSVRSRNESMKMQESLENMPSLTQCLAETRGANLEESSIDGHYDIFQDLKEDLDLESISSKIDELDANISTSSRKITRLRIKSLDLLTGVGDSRAYDWNEKKLSFVSGEQEIIRWQHHKNKLVAERNQIIKELHSKLVDKMTTSPLLCSTTKSVFPHLRDSGLGIASDTEMPSDRIKSDSITASLSAVSKLEGR